MGSSAREVSLLICNEVTTEGFPCVRRLPCKLLEPRLNIHERLCFDHAAKLAQRPNPTIAFFAVDPALFHCPVNADALSGQPTAAMTCKVEQPALARRLAGDLLMYLAAHTLKPTRR